MSTDNPTVIANGAPVPAPATANGAPQAPATAPKQVLSNAELKKQQKAEKQARRAARKTSVSALEESTKQQEQQQSSPKQQQSPKQAPSPKDAPEKQQQQQQQASPSKSQQKGEQQQPGAKPRRLSVSKEKEKDKDKDKEMPRREGVRAEPVKQVGLFGHLYDRPRRHNIQGAGKDIHPAVLSLGLQMSSYEVCGSNARCVAMLLAFKSVIQSYTTPVGTSLARHLTSHHLSPQIDFLKSCRPISISMGNAIRWLKDVIIKIDPDVPEFEAKQSLNSAIDSFIRERITVADTVISEYSSDKIADGDVIVTYAKSSIVLQTLLRAHHKGKKFKVVVVDSKPLFEGRRLAEELASHGLEVQYNLISAAAHAMEDASKVFLGAHAMMGNGRLYSRVGTAIVAMLAHSRDIPVIVCCESVKFTERVALDSIVGNEVAPAEELLNRGAEGEAEVKRWRETANLQLLNVLYDVTPAEYVKMVITEAGALPPSSVPAVLRNLSSI